MKSLYSNIDAVSCYCYCQYSTMVALLVQGIYRRLYSRRFHYKSKCSANNYYSLCIEDYLTMGFWKAEKRRVMATPQIDIARKRQKMDLDPPKIHSMHTRLDYFTQQSEKRIKILTEELKSIDQIIPRSMARSSQEDTSDESSDEECTQEDQTLKEVWF